MVRFTDRSHPSGNFRERRLRVALVGTDETALMAAALWMHQGAEFVGLCCLPPENSPDPALLPTLMTPAARMRRPSLAASALPAWGQGWQENPETEERQQQQQPLPPQRSAGKTERPNASPSSSASPSATAPLDVRHWTGPENLEGTPVTFHTGGSGGGFGGIRVVTPIGSWAERPHMIGLDNEAEIIEQADVVLLMGSPASQQRMLRVVGRHLRPGQALGAIPGGGGFGWKAGRFLQSQVRQGVALFALPVCPWRCRTVAGGEGAEFLATVELLGTSESEFITFSRDVGASDRADILRVFSQLFLTTRFRDGGDMLIASLHPFTTILIPGILYSFYRRSNQDLPNNENDVEPEESGDNFQPFQYFSEIDQYTVDILNQLDQELQQVKKGLEVYFKGHVDFSCFQSLEEYLSQAYHEQIEDHSNLLSIFRTNSAFRNLEIPYLTIRCEEIPKQPTSSSASDSASSSSVRSTRKVVDSPMMKQRARPQRRRTQPSSSSSSSSGSAVPVPVPPPPATSANNALFALPAQENSPSSSDGSGGSADKRQRRSSVGEMAGRRADPNGDGDGEEDEDEGRRNERLLRQFRNELAHGLLVAKAVADLVGVEVPGMVRILQAAQEDPLRMRILSEDAQLAGPDLGLSGCPQRFGMGSPSELIV